MLKNLSLAALLAVAALTTGCASVPMADASRDAQAKTFNAPADKANIYVYRNENMGAAVKMDVSLNDQKVGQTVADTYLLLTVPSGQHTLKSNAENESVLQLTTEAGKNYFVWQEVKMGVLYARNKLQQVDDATGREGVSECKLAQPIQ
ncbi:DUF2846 domain-containing protein [Pseudomonas sp. CrR25]|nr:DUF2846 domain-containing protein [Pseudomonas sp. CrR25]